MACTIYYSYEEPVSVIVGLLAILDVECSTQLSQLPMATTLENLLAGRKVQVRLTMQG